MQALDIALKKHAADVNICIYKYLQYWDRDHKK